MPFLRTIIFLQVLAGILVASQSTDVVCMPGWSWVRYWDSSLLQVCTSHSIEYVYLHMHTGEQLTRPKPLPCRCVYPRSLRRSWVWDPCSDHYTVFIGLYERQAYQIQALPGSHYSYTGPQKYQDNYCQCSTVTFSLVSACGLCQNATTITWAIFISWAFYQTTRLTMYRWSTWRYWTSESLLDN